MASNEMWMGPRGGECWVPAGTVGNMQTPVGWSGGTTGLNGGFTGRRSKNTHMEYTLGWIKKSRNRLRPVNDMYAGTRGPGLIYFIDPMAADLNVLPMAWSFPALATYDAPPIVGDVRPSRVPTPENGLNYPRESALYTGTGTSRKLYIPIPPGYSAWFGVHGYSSGTGGVCVTPLRRSGNPDADVFPPIIDVNDPTRVNVSFASADYTGIEVSFKGNASTSVAWAGTICQILPDGVTPTQGDFISGQGHSGCEFASAPQVTAESAALDKQSMVVKLNEVGDSQ